MEDIKRKAHFDELNKSKDEIGSSPRKYIGVPRPVRCIECGRLVDANVDKGHMTHIMGIFVTMFKITRYDTD